MPQLLVLGGNIARWVLEIEEMQIVNEGVDFTFLYFTLAVWFLTVVLNTIVITMLWEKSTIINQYMMLDCTVSIIYSSLATFQQSPYYMGLNLEMYCIPHMIVLNACIHFNRILPVIIAFYRCVNLNMLYMSLL